jgi:two-component system, CAI-1 autoinducer sensor kinase/phosphatase CqsS
MQEEIVLAPLEPILHPSRTRLVWVGAFTFLGHFVFSLVWGAWLIQPFESYGARLLMAVLSLLYVLPTVTKDPTSTKSGVVFGIATWVQLPCFFTWMYWMNEGNAVWLASVVAMILIYYHATDWRLASLGLITGSLLGWTLAGFTAGGTHLNALSLESSFTLMFAVIMGLMLGFSSANLRRTRLLNTLSTMAVMAHELRTPLATVNLMGDVLQTLAQNDVPDGKKKKLEELAARLQSLVRSMNRQIDTQISNAQLLRLPREQSPVMAAAMVQEVVNGYPYRSSRERDCVRVTIQQDFCFVASPQLFSQVLTNLLKNALHSLASASIAPNPGDLRIDVGLHHGKGRIAVSDDGVGIPHEQQQRIFEPFYSTQPGAGNGLGLTFCKNVVEAAHGRISLHSEPSMGAVFMIDLPLSSGTP